MGLRNYMSQERRRKKTESPRRGFLLGSKLVKQARLLGNGLQKRVLLKQATSLGGRKTVANSACKIHGGKYRDTGLYVGKLTDPCEKTYVALNETQKK